MNNKNKEIQTLHSSLTEAMVSKERLEQRVVELMEMSQHSMPDDSLTVRVQVSQHNTTREIINMKIGRTRIVHLCMLKCEFLCKAETQTLCIH